MRVSYVGPLDEVWIPATGHVAKRNGDPIDVPENIGRGLVEQDVWREHKPARKPAESKQKD